ncbi:MAG: hypothetical protein ACO22S_05100 [Burkholderiaceae bacterium]
MELTVSIAMNWILFIALFPIQFFWYRRAYRIFIKRDFSEVALKGGESPDRPERFAPFAGSVNLIAAALLSYVVFGILVQAMHFDTWSAIAGSTIWMKMIMDFVLRRHAHTKFNKPEKKTEPSAEANASDQK